eukprot:PLAT6257.1.p1 GENE.PLAT6257.1~~PLAT6257.1.p1  ORF type:complete len:217 (+),score=102.08 PLAT6257.1:40-690(+)
MSKTAEEADPLYEEELERIRDARAARRDDAADLGAGEPVTITSEGGMRGVLDRLELFFLTATVTSAISDFVREEAADFELVALDEEQPLQNMDIYRRYTELIERELQRFLDAEGITSRQLYHVLDTLKDVDSTAAACIDYLLASTEYDSFAELVYDFRDMDDWVDGDEDDEDDDGDAPDDGDDDDEHAGGKREEVSSSKLAEDDDEDGDGGSKFDD